MYKSNIKNSYGNVEYPDFNFIELDENKIRKYEEFFVKKITLKQKETIINRIENREEKSFLVLYRKQPAGYYHIAFSNSFDPSSGYIIKVKPNTVYLFDDYTLEEFRGKGCHSFSIMERLKHGLSNDCDTAIVLIYASNKISKKAYKKFGFKKEKIIVRLKLSDKLKYTFSYKINNDKSNSKFF